MKANWKTTVGGILAALGQALSSSAILPPPWSWIGPALAAAGVAFLGISATDRSTPPKK